MGRSKAQQRPSGAQPPAQELGGTGRGAPSRAADQCGLCGKPVAVEEEEHISGGWAAAMMGWEARRRHRCAAAVAALPIRASAPLPLSAGHCSNPACGDSVYHTSVRHGGGERCMLLGPMCLHRSDCLARLTP